MTLYEGIKLQHNWAKQNRVDEIQVPCSKIHAASKKSTNEKVPNLRLEIPKLNPLKQKLVQNTGSKMYG